MSRIHRRILVAVLVGAAALVAFVLLRKGGEEEIVLPAPPPAPEPKISEALPPSAESPKALPISGHVLGRQSAPVAGLSVACGEEVVVTDATGAFLLPAAVRPGTVSLHILRDGLELCSFDGVIAGAGPAPPREGQDLVSAMSPAPQLGGGITRVRWTVCLPGLGQESSPEAPWLRIESILCEDLGSWARVRVTGSSRLPEGALVTTSLYFDGARLLASSESSEVRGGEFEVALESPQGFRLHSALYEVQVAFNSVLQRAELLQEWLELPGGPPPMDIEESALVFLGDSEEGKAEDAAVAAYYDRVLDEVRALERTLKARVEEVLDLLWGWDPAILRRLQDESRFVEMASRARNWDPSILAARRESRDGWFYSEFVEGGVFQEARWRRFLDEEWRPAVERLIEQHQAREQPKYPEAEARLSALLEALLYESRNLSSFVVYPSYLPRHPNDFYPDDEGPGDMGRLENLVKGNFQELQRYRTLGGEGSRRRF